LDLRPREWAIAVALSIMIFWIGLYPAPFLNRINGSVQALTERLERGSGVSPAPTAAERRSAVVHGAQRVSHAP